MTARTIPSGLAHTLGRDALALLSNVGELAHNTLFVAADVVDNTSVVIGGETWRIDIISTDSTKVTPAILPNNAIDVTIHLVAHSFVLGDLIRIDSEIMRVIEVATDDIKVSRARCGTSTASHAAAATINKANRAKGSAIPLGLTATLTPAAFLAAFVAEVNAGAGSVTDQLNAINITTGVLLVAKQPGVLTLACTETLAGTGNVWAKANLDGGLAPGSRRTVVGTHVPTANEVTAGQIVIPVNFDVAAVIVQMRVTSSGIPLAWVGAITIVDDGAYNHVILDNSGATDWATTTTISYVISE